MLRLGGQRAKADRRKADAAVFTAQEQQPVDGAQQGAGSEAGKPGQDDRRRTCGAARDGTAQLPRGQGNRSRHEGSARVVEVQVVPTLYQRVRAYNVAFYKNRAPEIYQKALAHLIEETKRGRMFGEWNDYGRLPDD